MFTLRPSADRGATSIGWLNSRHSFSFGDYHDPKHHQFRSLRVINDDHVAGGGGFPPHPHRDMEILSYVLSGRLAHSDSMGHGTTIGPGEWQKMSAGTGVVHSEFNPSPTDPVHFYQVWILPDRKGRTPEYDQKHIPTDEKRNRWRTVASSDGRDDSIVVHQDVVLSATVLEPDHHLTYALAAGRAAWVQVLSGTVTVNGRRLSAGDAAAVDGEPVELVGQVEGEVLLFDLM